MIVFSSLNNKFVSRFGIIALNAIRQVIVPAFSFFISWLVLKSDNPGLWGEFVYLYAIVQISGNILDWGNKELLLREFSTNPAVIKKLWKNSIISRSLLFFIPLIWILFLNISPKIKFLLFVWVLFRFFLQIFEVLIVYNKAFKFSAITEVTGFLLILSGVFLWGNTLDLPVLISFYVLSYFLKFLISIIYFRKWCLNEFSIKPTFNSMFLIQAFPFFLLGFSGLIQSRADILIIKQYLPAGQLGYYQVLINLLFFAHAIPSFILLPYVKNIYRLKKNTANRIAERLFIVAPLFIMPALGVIYFIMNDFYKFETNIFLILWAGVFLIPSFYYSPIVYRFFQSKKQNRVVVINIAGLFINISANIILLPLFGVLGAIVACAIAQCGILAGCLFYQKLDVKKELKIITPM